MKSKSFPECVAIIEFDSSHDECLLTQINALKNHGCWVMLITNTVIKSRNKHLEELVDEWSLIDPRGVGLTGASLGDAIIIRRLMRFLKKRRITKVVFNTAQGGHVRNACLFSLFRKVEFIGIIHTIRKFKGSFTQKIINLKIKKYFVLAEFLREQIPPQKGILFETFYPIDFPKSHLAVKNDEEFHISIIGSVESRRKDLSGFISLIQQIDSSVQFNFLGKAAPKHLDVIQLKEKLREMACLSRVTFYDDYTPFDEIDQILRKTSVILPLIHPATPSANEYFRNQIPGAMNIALAYHIPLLLHEHFERIREIHTAAFYYEMDQFSESLDNLRKQSSSINQMMISTKEYSSSWNQERYLKFLFS